MIYTTFPMHPVYCTDVPQDFETYEEAKEYGDETWGAGNYTIEETEGNCV